ncbi:MAG: ABC transporter ATP-binding protein [Halioglobus sp.]
MIEVQSLARHFGNTIAVDDVSFSIGNQEIVGLLGHNGAGKTTIMRMLSGCLEPTAGTIVIDGVDLAIDARQMQERLGYLPENLPVYPEMMVADYLDYVATVKDSRFRTPTRSAQYCSPLIWANAFDSISVLSRGLRQRVGVAQALRATPPADSGRAHKWPDPHQTEQMRRLIKRLARRCTIILSTHIMQEVDAVCDRVIMLRNGRLALDQGLTELHHSSTLLVRTSATGQPLASYLNRLPQVRSLQHTDDADRLMCFNIQLHPNVDLDTAANNIAQCVIKAGAKLYGIQVLKRDLDTVFREVYSSGD